MNPVSEHQDNVSGTTVRGSNPSEAPGLSIRLLHPIAGATALFIVASVNAFVLAPQPLPAAETPKTAPSQSSRLSPFISPYRRHLAFATSAAQSFRSIESTIVVTDLDGSNRRVIGTAPGPVERVYWLGNDRLLTASEQPKSIRLFSLSGKPAVDISFPPDCDILYPVPSPDGRSIAFVGSHTVAADERQFGLFVLDREKGTLHQLLYSALKTAPAWSPDSRQIAIGNVPGYVQCYPLVIVDVETGAVIDTGIKGVGAAYSPDGRYLAFSADIVRGGSWFRGVPIDGRIGVLDLQNHTLTLVTPPGWNSSDKESGLWEVGGYHRPVWSPDSRWIACVRADHRSKKGESDSDKNEIWVVNRDGTQLRKVMDSAPDFAWGPQGKTLIFLEDGKPKQIDAFAGEPTEYAPPTPAPVTFSEPTVPEPAATPHVASFDPTPVFERNQLWTNPPLDKPRSVSFVHAMKPKELDERFLWRNDGASLLEVVARGDKEAAREVGRRWITTPEGAYYTVAPGAKLAGQQNVKPDFLGNYLRNHLMGTRTNFAALDWGRHPDAFVIRTAEKSKDGKTNALTLVPRDRGYRINAGAMFHTSSWGYVHDVQVLRIELTLDATTFAILHEEDFSRDDKLVCTIDFEDWKDVSPNRSVPQRIHLQFPDGHFDVDYRFAWHPEGLWILSEGRATFKGQEPQIETIRNLRINHPLPDLVAALDRVKKSESLLNAKGTEFKILKTTVYPFTLGKSCRFQDVPPPPAFAKPERMVFSLDSDGNLVAEIVLTRNHPTDTRAGTAAVALYNESDPGPFHAGWAPYVFHDDTLTTTVRVTLGNSSTLRDSRFFQISLTATGNATPFALEPDLPTTLRSIHTYPFTLDTRIPLSLSGGPENKTQIKGITFHRGEGGDLSADVEYVTRDRGKVFNLFAPILLLSKEGIPFAASQCRADLLVDKFISGGSVRVGLGPIGEELADACFAIALTREYTGYISGVAVYGNTPSPIFPIETMLDSEDGGVRAFGVRSLEKKLRLDGINQELGAWRHGREKNAKETPAGQLAPYVDRFDALFQITNDPAALAILCRLAGFSSNQRFKVPLTPLLHNSDPAVCDAAAIGLGLLGDLSGEPRIVSILAQPLPTVEDRSNYNTPWWRGADLQTDAACALLKIGTKSAINDLGRAFVASVDGIVATPGKTGGVGYSGTFTLADRMTVLLGHTRNVDVFPYFLEAMDKGRNGEIIAGSVLRMVARFPDSPEKTKLYHHAVREGIGRALYEIKTDPDYFDDAVALVRNPETSGESLLCGIEYLEKQNDARALAPLREAHDARYRAEFPYVRTALAQALAHYGDTRGLDDLFSIAKDALTTSTLPKDLAERRYEQFKRDRNFDSIRDALQKSNWRAKDLTAFLIPRLQSPDPATRAAAHTLLARLTKIPPELQRFAENKNTTHRAN